MLSALNYILLLLRVQEIGFSNNQYYFSQIQTKEITMTIIFAKHRFFKIVIKMTYPKVNRVLFPWDPQCCPRQSRGERWDWGETNLAVSPLDQSLKCFVILPNSNMEKINAKKLFAWCWLVPFTNLPFSRSMTSNTSKSIKKLCCCSYMYFQPSSWCLVKW